MDQEILALSVLLGGVVIAALAYVLMRMPAKNKLANDPHTETMSDKSIKVDLGVWQGIKFGFGLGLGFFAVGISVVVISFLLLSSFIMAIMAQTTSGFGI